MGGPCLGQVSGTAMHFPARSGVLHCPAGYRQACPAGHWRLPIPPQVWPVWAVAAPAARIRASPSSVNGSVLDLMTNLLVYRECAAAVAGPYFRECKFHPIGAMPPAFGAARSRPEDFRTALGSSKWLRRLRNHSEPRGASAKISERLSAARNDSEAFRTTPRRPEPIRGFQNDSQQLEAAPKVSKRLSAARSGSEVFRTTFSGSERLRSLGNAPVYPFASSRSSELAGYFPSAKRSRAAALSGSLRVRRVLTASAYAPGVGLASTICRRVGPTFPGRPLMAKRMARFE